MKFTYFLLLISSVSNVYAATLPSLNDSNYSSPSYGGSGSGYTTYTPPPVSSTQISSSLYKIQSDISDLKRTMSDLKARQDKLEQKQWALHNPTPTPPQSLKTAISSDPHVYATTQNEKINYAHAYELLRLGDNDHAIAEFQSLISSYPNGEYADNALYWTGEALLKKGDKQGAMRSFDRVVYAYPRSGKVPDALLKLGMTQASLGNSSKAKAYYDYLTETYPGTPAASLAYEKIRTTRW
jgi:tol-pal system protein YbgF